MSEFKDVSASEMKSESETIKLKGNEYFKCGKYIEAIQQYSNAIKLNDKNEKLYSNRALCYQNINRYDDALNDIKKAIKLNNKWYKAYFRQGNIYELMNDKHNARNSYNKAIKLCNNDNDIKLINGKLSKLDYLTKNEIVFYMKKALNNAKLKDGMTKDERPDFVERIKIYNRYISGKNIKIFKCKDLFGFDNKSQMMYILSQGAKAMGCHGNGYCDFKTFGIKINDNNHRNDVILSRFHEWIQSGMCVECQHTMFEQ